jgi:tRNA (guanine37-N1)-methyltransferase
MRVQVLTIFPELFEPFLRTSLIGRAIEKGVLEVRISDLRSWSEDRHRSVDDEPYGGGGGMVMTAPPWLRAVRGLARDESGERSPWRVLMSPQGARLDDAKVRELADRGDLLLMCGRYEGIDERVREALATEEISIGDYVLSGGEVPALAVIDAVARLVPGVVGDDQSVEADSFTRGLLDYPHYTRPAEFEGLKVPDVLLSGHHGEIRRWRRETALQRTVERRPDLLAGAALDADETEWLKRSKS